MGPMSLLRKYLLNLLTNWNQFCSSKHARHATEWQFLWNSLMLYNPLEEIVEKKWKENIITMKVTWKDNLY